jgi:hypothetical protein
MRPRRASLTVEPLEDRALPSGLSFQYVIQDPGHEFDPYPLLRTDLQASGQILSGMLNGQGTLQVLVRPDDTIPRSDGSTVGVQATTSSSSMTVIEPTALTQARTGVNPNGSGPVIELEFNARDYLPHVWFDPSGAARSGRVPAGHADFLSVALHETLHALGFQGYRQIDGAGYGSLSSTESNFDALTSFTNGILYFRGPLATAIYGGPVPLTTVGSNETLSSQNFYHLGNPAGRPGANLSGDIMNGMVFQYGTRYTPSKLDLAILADLGWSVPGFPAPVVPTVAAPVVVQPAPAVPPAGNLPPARKHVRRPKHPIRHPAHRTAGSQASHRAAAVHQ